MSWLELDDGILRHPKFIRATRMAGSEAVHLWLGLRAYCGQFLTDGLIPTDMIDSVDGPASNRSRARALEALVKCGLLDEVDGGLQMHDYLDWSRSREEIEARRQATANRQRRHRGQTQPVTRDNAVTNASVTPLVTPSPSPSPSPPILSPPDPDQNMPATRARVRSARIESEAFKAFYAAYPRHVGRDTAWSAWKAKACEELASEIMAALEWQKRLVFASCPSDKVPHPASWINAGRWKDERPRAALTVSRPDPNCRGWHEGGKNTGRKHPSGRQPMCPECKSIELREWTADDRTGEPTLIGEIS